MRIGLLCRSTGRPRLLRSYGLVHHREDDELQLPLHRSEYFTLARNGIPPAENSKSGSVSFTTHAQWGRRPSIESSEGQEFGLPIQQRNY